MKLNFFKVKELPIVLQKIKNYLGIKQKTANFSYLKPRDIPQLFPLEFDETDKDILSSIISKNLSMCSFENLYTTLLACKYVKNLGVEGDFFECGVWRGGNSLLAAHEFAKDQDSQNRKVFLLDTFSGMVQPTEIDIRISDKGKAIETYLSSLEGENTSWCYASLDEVKSNFIHFNLLKNNVHFLKGKAEEILCNPSNYNLPDQISVLRLDTDWYESTLIELQVLWPRLAIGGILIIDDYGYWEGCKRAVDDFFESKTPFLMPIDQTARVAIKIK